MSDKIGVYIETSPTSDRYWKGYIELRSEGVKFPFQIRFNKPLSEIKDVKEFADRIFTENHVGIRIINENGGGVWLCARNLHFWMMMIGAACHAINGIAISSLMMATTPAWWDDDLPSYELVIPRGIHYDLDPDPAIDDLLASVMSAS